MSDNTKNPERVAAGLKATVHNPSVSDEAKDRARERLKEMGVDVDGQLSSRDAKGNTSAAATGSGASEEYDLDNDGYEPSSNASFNHDSEKTDHHRLGGYKATINNPRVSNEAKDHAKEVLKDSDAL